MKRLIPISATATLLAASAFAFTSTFAFAAAQNGAAPAAAPVATAASVATAPTAAARPGYSGPSGAPLMNVKDLLAKGKDEQYVRLKGKLTSHKGDEDYEFTDASGRITVEIDADRFPQGMTVDHTTVVELTGEFDKEMFGEATLDVEQIKVVGG